jgi:nicotinate dehydrogenase subunit B
MKNGTKPTFDFRSDGFPAPIARREFFERVGILGGGLIVYCTLGNPPSKAAQGPMGIPGGDGPTDFNAFIKIGADGKVTCTVGKIEMGQGPITAFPQIVADELDVPYESVEMILGDTDLCPYDFGTVGSMSIRIVGPQVRKAACEARGVLKELAADYLKCSVAELDTKDGVVFQKTKPDNKVGYGQLTKGKIIEKHLKDLPSFKSPSEFKVMGKPHLHRDAYEKVTGKAKYAGDIRLPDMLYACILRPPAHGAMLKNVDVSEAKKLEGAQVVQEEDLIAVLHKTPDGAQQAVQKIKAEWDKPKSGFDNKTIFDHLGNFKVEPQTPYKSGDIEKGRNLAKEIFEETYVGAYVAHAPQEPHTGIVSIENGKATARSSTQNPFTVQENVAKALGIDKTKVRVITPFVGGGFGGKGYPNPNRETIEAAKLAKIIGKPVQVAFSRAEEFFYDTFRPAAVIKVKSGLDHSNRVIFYESDIYMAGDRCCEILYDVPNHRETIYGNWMAPPEGAHPFGVGPWRAPGSSNNLHAKEMQMSLMAAKAGVDPLEFRLNHITDNRLSGVLKAVAEKFGYKPSKLPSGRGYGMCCAIDANTYVAHMAEVAVDKNTGKIEVKKVVCAQDMGLCVNPQGSKIQMEGAIIMGLGAALMEEITFKNGEIFNTNYDNYYTPRFSWLPKIETIIIENNNFDPQGGGEPGITGIAAIIATGVFDATGAKLLQLPMTPDRVKEALKKS